MIDLSKIQAINGGKVLVVGGYNKSFTDYRDHPMVEFWSGDDMRETQRHIQNKDIPSNTRAVVISRFISHSTLEPLLEEARRRRLTIFPNLADGQVVEVLDRLVVKHEKPIKVEPVKRGELKSIVAQHDVTTLPPADAARSIAEILTEKGIASTLSSIIQAVRKHRRASGLTTPPPSIRKQDAIADVVNLCDDTVASLQLMRETIVKLAAENKELRAKLSKIQSAIGGTE